MPSKVEENKKTPDQEKAPEAEAPETTTKQEEVKQTQDQGTTTESTEEPNKMTRQEEIEQLFKLLEETKDPICVNCDSPSHGTAVIVEEVSRLVKDKDGNTKKKRKIYVRSIHITGLKN